MEKRFAGNFPKGTKDETSSKFKGGSKALIASFCGKNVLFFLERNTNNNCVVYEANVVVGSDGKKMLDPKSPVKVYDRVSILACFPFARKFLVIFHCRDSLSHAPLASLLTSLLTHRDADTGSCTTATTSIKRNLT